MTLKEHQIYPIANGQKAEILKVGIPHPYNPSYYAIGMLENGSVMYWDKDGTCPGNSAWNLLAPKKKGFVKVFTDYNDSYGKLVPFEYEDEKEK